MTKSKKILGLLCAVGLTIGSGTAVYAASDYVSGYLSSCGSVDGYSASFLSGSTKCVKSDTCSQYNTYRIRTDMAAVNRSTGSTVASGYADVNSTSVVTVTRSVSASTSVTVYGTHQVWGTGSDYWGKYTTVTRQPFIVQKKIGHISLYILIYNQLVKDTLKNHEFFCYYTS